VLENVVPEEVVVDDGTSLELDSEELAETGNVLLVFKNVAFESMSLP